MAVRLLLFQTTIRSAALVSMALLIGALASVVLPDAPMLGPCSVGQAEWMTFRQLYITDDGRVIDTANGGVSHSEGQGYGMLLAVANDDRTTFERLRRWTADTLKRRSDALHAWRYEPNAAAPVADDNTASDGDLFIAWALLRAGTHWHDLRYTEDGTAIARDLLRLAILNYHGLTVLAPGVRGFEHQNGYVLNLSYYAFAAFRELARAAPDPAWAKLEADGLSILRRARFGAWELWPDWLLLTPSGEIRPAEGWPARFSWDAIRVPLHLAWAGLREPQLQTADRFWSEASGSGRPPAWVNLPDNEVSAEPGGAGVRAIMSLGHAALRQDRPSSWPHVEDAENYYQAALVLLARTAAAESPGPPAVTAQMVATVISAPERQPPPLAGPAPAPPTVPTVARMPSRSTSQSPTLHARAH